MALIDELEKQYGITPVLPSTTPTSGIIGEASDNLIDQLELRYGLRGLPPTQVPDQRPQPQPQFAGQIVEESPLSLSQRGILSTARTEQGREGILRNFGFEPLRDDTGRLLARDQRTGVVHAVDENRFSLGDVADLFGGAINFAGLGFGSVIGGGLGTITGGPVGGFFGRGIGGTIGSGYAEAIRQKIAEKAGGIGEADTSAIAREAIVGGLTAPLFGIGPRIAARTAPAIGTTLTRNIAGQTIESGVIRAAPTISRQIGAEATENVLQGTVSRFASTLYDTGDVKQAAIAAGANIPTDIAFTAGTLPLARMFGDYATGLRQERIGAEVDTISNMLARHFANRDRIRLDEVDSFIRSLPVDELSKNEIIDSLKTVAPRGEILSPTEIPVFRPTFETVEDFAAERGVYIRSGAEGETGTYYRVPKPEELSGARAYDTSSANIVVANTKESTSVLKRALKNSANTKAQKAIIQDALTPDEKGTRGYITEELIDTIPSINVSARELGYDGIRVFTKTNPDTPSSTFIWNKGKVQEIGDITEEFGKFFEAEEQAFFAVKDPITISAIKKEANRRLIELYNKEKPIKYIDKFGDVKEEKRFLTPEEEAEKLFLEENMESPGIVAEKYGYTIGEAVPREEELPIIYRTPAGDIEPDGTLDKYELLDYISSTAPASTKDVGVVSNKIIDMLTGRSLTDIIDNPNKAQSKIARDVGRAFGRLENAISGLGPIGRQVTETLQEIVKVSSRLSTKAHENLRKVSKTLKTLTETERRQAIELLVSNRRTNPDLTGRGLYSLKELQDRTTSTKVKQVLKEVFDVEEEISRLRQGTPFRNAKGAIVRKAVEPAPFWPIFFADQDVYFGSNPRSQIALQKLIAKNLQKGMPDDVARSEAIRELGDKAEFASTVRIANAAEKFYNNYDEMVGEGLVIDIEDALQRMIARDSKQAALIDVLGRQKIAAASETEAALGDAFVIARRYGNKIYADISDAVDEFVKRGKFGSAEGARYKDALQGYIDVVIGGANVNEYIRKIKRFHALKLTFSAFKNAIQPLNIMLYNDMPSLARGIASAYGLGDPTEALARYGLKTGKELAVESGSYIADILETAGAPMREKLFNLIRPMTMVEGRNRIAASISGLNFAEKLSKDLNTLIAKASKSNRDIASISDAKRRLEMLIGRTVDTSKEINLEREDILNAAYNNTKATQFGYDPLSLPGWISGTPYGQLAGQFKTYAYNQLALLFNSTVGEIRSGNPGKATRNLLLILGIMAPAELASDKVLDVIYGKEDDESILSVKRYLDSASTIITGGWMDSILRAPTGAHFATNILLGPSGQTVADIRDVGGKVVKDVIDGDYEGIVSGVLETGLRQFGGLGRAAYNQLLEPAFE